VIHGNLRHKTHLLFTWADELVHHPAILDAVADVIGPDILCWTTNFFIKEPSSAGFVSWHQDSTYWGLDPADVVTAWVAFTDATPENGYMQFIPGTHTVEQLPHLDTFHRDNLLSRGQEIAVEVDKQRSASPEAGESRSTTSSWHGSEPNRSPDRDRLRHPYIPITCARPIRDCDAGARHDGIPLRPRAARADLDWRPGRPCGGGRPAGKRSPGHRQARFRA
jgi:hypothetical protein